MDCELDRLQYRRLDAWFDYLEKRTQLGVPTNTEIENFAEMKASRDILVHNRGIVNEMYSSKAGRYARCVVDEKLEIIEPYLIDCWQLITKVVSETSAAAIAKLETSMSNG